MIGIVGKGMMSLGVYSFFFLFFFFLSIIVEYINILEYKLELKLYFYNFII